jgi:C-terminal processing protease CtpA/Prc
MRAAWFALGYVFLGSAFAADTPVAPVPEFLRLADRRVDITLPRYTPAQRKTVAEQALILLENMYVHRDLRRGRFGEEVDPVPKVKKILENAERSEDNYFHSQLARTFFSQRDRHTNYYYPRPRACYKSALPFSLTIGQDPSSREPLVVVRSLLTKPEAVALSPGMDRIHPGDVLLRFDDQPVADKMKELDRADNGANPGASFRVRTTKLTLLNHLADPLPKFDTARLVFLDRTKFPYKEYSIELPWLSQVNAHCLEEAARDIAPPAPVTPTPVTPAPATPAPAKAKGGRDDDRLDLEYERFYKPVRKTGDGPLVAPPPEEGPPSFANLTDTKDPIIHWKTLSYERAKVGYLRLDSFEPANFDGSTQLIRGLLLKEFADTDGLIIDLRDNGGGWITWGESLVQLFTAKDVETEDFSLLNTEANRNWLVASKEMPEFRVALEATPARNRYSNPWKLTPLVVANQIGQAYFRPVVILTNARCFSTCDMFTAGMQDHGAALVVGEDKSTGGGGANVIEQEYFLSKMPEGHTAPFEKLPRGQGMRIAWREALRVGPTRRLEIDGVQAEKVLTPDPDDVAANYAATASKLTDWLLARRSPVISELRLANEERADFPEGAALEFAATVRGTDRVEYRLQGLPANTEEFRSSFESTPMVVRPAVPAEFGFGHVEAKGFLHGERVWRRELYFRRVPKPTTVALPLAIDFKGTSPVPRVYTLGKAENGWTISPEGSLKIGDGVKYADNLSTEASWFLDFGTAKPSAVTIEMQYNTEPGSDFVELVAISGGNRASLIGPLSGSSERNRWNALLPEGFRGPGLELRLEFHSDDGVSDKGVTVYGLKVE